MSNSAPTAGAPAAALANGVAAPESAPHPGVGDDVEIRCEEDGRWYQATVASQLADGTYRVCFHKDGYEYHCPLGIWRSPLQRAPRDVLEVRCKDDGQWYEAEVEGESGDGPTLVRFEKEDGYEYHYPLVDFRVRRAPKPEGAEALPPAGAAAVPVAPEPSGTKETLGLRGAAAPRVVVSELEDGQALRGRVEKLGNTAFHVDVGAEKLMLVFKPELLGLATKPEEVVSVGQEVDLWVKKKGGGRVRLTMQDPQATTSFDGIGPDEWLQGRVRSVKSFGAFVRVCSPDGGAHLEGLVHISSIQDQFVSNAEDVLKPGDDVSVRLIKYEGGRASFSMLPLKA